MTLRVLASGPRTTVQDLGRPGLAHLGVGPSGALDPLALRRANALVGNSRSAAGLEVLVGGLVLQATAPTALACVGAGEAETHWLLAGERWALPPADRLLAYVAVRGGLAVPPVLGSRSTDLLTGLGGRPLRDGDLLAVGGDAGPPEPVPAVPAAVPGTPVRLLPPPRAGLLHEQLLGGAWEVASDTSRTAVRLDGPSLRGVPDGVPPEGLVTGAVQVPPSGRPVVLLADRPVTGGYALAGVVRSEDLRLLAQAPPGEAVRFVPG